ncbi:MAG: UDP-N-acetylmuramate dehydrogenase [Candidatus Zixiibacteriota bacterium]
MKGNIMVERGTAAPALPIATLLAAFGPNLEFAKDMAPLTSYNTGGPARYFLAAESAAEITRGITEATRLGIPCFVIGGGSNLLISDDGFDGLIIKVDVRGIALSGDCEIKVGAGEDLMDLVNFATEHALTGIEFLAGIWGTVGGAVYGNAGAFGVEIGSVVTGVTIVTRDGKVKSAPPEYCRFGYRDSYLKTSHEVVVDTRIRLTKGERGQIKKKVDDILAQRETKHPSSLTAGCFFKNIPDAKEKYGKLPAGRLLDEAGVKGLKVGGARVYEKHANIIVNDGHATSKEIRQLADIMKQRVKDRFGIVLEEEVQQIGKF